VGTQQFEKNTWRSAGEWQLEGNVPWEADSHAADQQTAGLF
jgi:hypothetical protein